MPANNQEMGATTHQGFTLLGHPNVTPTNMGNLSHFLRKSSELFDLVSSTSDVDHPLCQDCADSLLLLLEQQLAQAEEECQEYKQFLAKITKESEEESLSNIETLEKELSCLQLEEEQLKAELKELQVQKFNFFCFVVLFDVSLLSFTGQAGRGTKGDRGGEGREETGRQGRGAILENAQCPPAPAVPGSGRADQSRLPTAIRPGQPGPVETDQRVQRHVPPLARRPLRNYQRPAHGPLAFRARRLERDQRCMGPGHHSPLGPGQKGIRTW